MDYKKKISDEVKKNLGKTTVEIIDDFSKDADKIKEGVKKELKNIAKEENHEDNPLDKIFKYGEKIIDVGFDTIFDSGKEILNQVSNEIGAVSGVTPKSVAYVNRQIRLPDIADTLEKMDIVQKKKEETKKSASLKKKIGLGVKYLSLRSAEKRLNEGRKKITDYGVTVEDSVQAFNVIEEVYSGGADKFVKDIETKMSFYKDATEDKVPFNMDSVQDYVNGFRKEYNEWKVKSKR